MKRAFFLTLAPLLALLSAVQTAPAQAAETALTAAQQAEVRELVRKTLMEQPEILSEAISVLRQRQEAKEQEDSKTAIRANAAQLFNLAADPELGNPKGDVTLVEFFDYRCGYCKSVFPMLMDTLAKDSSLRLVMKELPVLGDDSVLAAHWALAAKEQGKYKEMHLALMKFRGNLTVDSLRKIAKENGMDVDRLEKAAQSDAVTAQLRKNMELASALGIGGTPAFVIGDTLVPGALEQRSLLAMIEKARSAKGKD